MNPRDEARRLLEETGFETLPIVPQDICKRLRIQYAELPFESFEGIIRLTEEGQIFIGVNSQIKEPGRKNFTCAHELGHSCMDLFDKSAITCSKTEVESFNEKIRSIELRANRFAAELLFPRHLLPAHILDSDPEWTSVEKLADNCNASLLASAHRFIEMTDHSCALVVSENRRVSYYRRSKSFGAFPDMDSRALSKQSFAYAAFSDNHRQNDFEVVAADLWLPASRKNRDAELLEWSRPVNSYGQVLTLLWDDSGVSTQTDSFPGDEPDETDDVSTEWEPPTFHRSKRRP